MNAREQKTVKFGGIAAVIIVFMTYVVMPWMRGGGMADSANAAKRERAAIITQKVKGRDALLKRRNVLAMRLGSLTGDAAAKPAAPPEKESEKAPEKAPESAPDKATEKAPEATPDKATEKAPEAAPDKATEKAPEAAPEKDTEKTPDAAPEKDTEKTPEVAPEKDTEKTPDAAPEKAAEKAPDAAPEKTAEKAPEGDKPTGPAAAKKDAGDAASAKKPGAPPAPSGVGIVTHIERAAKKAGMKVKRVTPLKRSSQNRKWNHFNAVTLQVNVEGDAGGFLKFLYEIERGNRFMRIDQIRLRRDIKKNTVDINFDVMAYEAV